MLRPKMREIWSLFQSHAHTSTHSNENVCLRAYRWHRKKTNVCVYRCSSCEEEGIFDPFRIDTTDNVRKVHPSGANHS